MTGKESTVVKVVQEKNMAEHAPVVPIKEFIPNAGILVISLFENIL